MAAGENITEIDWLQLGGSGANGILKISDNVCCTGTGNGTSCVYRTVQMENDGTLPTQIDSISQYDDRNHQHAPMIHIHGNIYGYYFSIAPTMYQTVGILPDGNFVGMVDSTPAYPWPNSVDGMDMGTIHMHDDVYVFTHYGGFSGNAMLRSIIINSQGYIASVSNMISTGYKYPVKIIRISDNVFASLSRTGTTGYIRTFYIDDNGIINGTPISTITYSTSTTEAIIIHIKDNIYAISHKYSSTNWLITIEIDPDGYIHPGIIDTFTPHASGSFHDICHVSGTAYAVTSQLGSGTASKLYVTTVDISNNGTINSIIDGPHAFLYGSGYNSYITYMHDDIYAVVHNEYPAHVSLSTLSIDTPSGTPSRRQLFTGGLSHRAMR